MRLLALISLLWLAFAPLTADPAWAQAPAGTPAPAADATPAAPDSAEAARLLADVIEDPAAREALVRQLRAASEGTPAEPGAAVTAPPAEAPAAEETAAAPSVGQSVTAAVAAHTLGLAEGVAAWAKWLWATVTDFDGIRAQVAGVNWPRLSDAVIAVGTVMVVTIGLLSVARRVTRGPRARLAAALATRVGGAHWARRLVGLVVVMIFDLVLILLAWAAGYALALSLGEAGRMDIRQSLFLNAFLLVECLRLGLRLLFAPNVPALRFWEMGDARARQVTSGLGLIAALLGYGLLLAVPVARSAVSWRFAGVVETCVVLGAAVLAIRLVLRNRGAAAAALDARAASDPQGLVGAALGVLARIWHLLAIAYVFGVLLVWSSRPADSLGFVLGATISSVIAIVAGTLLMLVLTRLIAGGVTLPERMRERLPMLEARLNTYVPNLLALARLALFAGVVAAILRVWNIYDLPGWFTTETGRAWAEGLISAGMIVLMASLLWLAVSSWIDYRADPHGRSGATARERTLLALLRNGVAVVLAVMTLMFALSAVGVNIAPLIAGAGVVGLAVGFGAQTLVKDIITGAFIQLENAMNTGDVVTAGGVTGTVERLTIRSVSLRDGSGTYHLVPFSSVAAIANFNKDFSYHVADVVIARQKDIARTKEIMREAFEELKAGPQGQVIIGPFDMQGVSQLGVETITVRARIMTRPGKHWAVGRAYSELVAHKLDAADIEAAREPVAEPVPAGV